MKVYMTITVLLLLLFTGSAEAQVMDVSNAVVGNVTGATSVLTLATGNIIAGVILNSSSTTAVVEVYDTAVISSRAAALADAGHAKIMIKVAADEAYDKYLPPLGELFSTGIFIYVSDGQAVIKRRAGI